MFMASASQYTEMWETDVAGNAREVGGGGVWGVQADQYSYHLYPPTPEGPWSR